MLKYIPQLGDIGRSGYIEGLHKKTLWVEVFSIHSGLNWGAG